MRYINLRFALLTAVLACIEEVVR